MATKGCPEHLLPNAMWSKTGRSTLAAEVVENECKLQLIRPNLNKFELNLPDCGEDHTYHTREGGGYHKKGVTRIN